jgi:hypothetical protein
MRLMLIANACGQGGERGERHACNSSRSKSTSPFNASVHLMSGRNIYVSPELKEWLASRVVGDEYNS